MLGPWAPSNASEERKQATAVFDLEAAAAGRVKRQFSYLKIACPEADGSGDGVHFTNLGAKQLLDSGVATGIRRFVRGI